VEVLATACEALSIVDERKDSAGITSDNCQILPLSNQNIYSQYSLKRGTTFYVADGFFAQSSYRVP
jgi:hypothetical protein